VNEPVEDLVRLEAFTYLTVPERAVYLAIMRLFTASLMTDLSAQQVVEELAGQDLELSLDTAVSRLNQLDEILSSADAAQEISRELLGLINNEDTAADLYTSAFGLYSARHLGIAADPEAVVAATASWWPAAAVGG
jgi:hypothetical protein